MQLSQISLAITRLGGVPFGPAALFANGEQGAWYDPSDLTTLFQDSAGTTPVTAVEQAVGLMLDKSKGATAGPNVVINGNFTTDSDWTKGTGWTITGGAAQGTTIGGLLTQSGVLVSGTWYKATVVISAWTGSYSLTVGFGATNTFIITAYTAGTYTGYFVAPSNDLVLRVNTGSGVPGTISVDSLVVQALPGNHAFQSTSTSRPILRARYNLLTYSEQFDNAYWTTVGGSVSSNTTVAPDGTTTADTYTATATTARHCVLTTSNVSVSANTTHTLSWYIKKSNYNFVTLIFGRNTSEWIAATIDFSAATPVVSKTGVGTTGTLVSSPVITAAGNGFWRVSFNASLTGTLAYAEVALASSANPTYGTFGEESWTATGGEAVIVWGAQLIVTNSLTSNAYQRIAAATDYNTSGFLPYLFFDGTDDSLLTNSVDFTATDKMTVWAGLRKLAAAGTAGITVELGTSADSVNGSIALVTPGGASNQYLYASKGTAATAYAVTTSASFAAPITNVLTGTSNIAGDSVTLRVNGADVASDTSDQGTGAYQNAALYIGRRNNATLPLNGNLYSLIIRGAQSSAAQISATEAWVNGKTGAY